MHLMLLLMLTKLKPYSPSCCRCCSSCCCCCSSCSGTQSNHLEDLQDDLREHGEDTAQASGDEATGIERAESAGNHSKWIRQTLHSAWQDLLQSTVNTPGDVDASLLCSGCS